MRKVTKIYTVYDFKELDKKAQKNAIEEAYEWLSQERCDHLKDDLLEEMEYNYGIIPDDLFYSLSYSQGDGLCFTLKNILSYTRLKNFLYDTGSLDSLNPFEKAVVSDLDKEKQNLLLEYLNYDYNISIKKTSWMYEHSHTCDFEWEYYRDDDAAKEDVINSVVEEICSHAGLFRGVYDDVCDKLEKLGYEIGYPEEEEVVEYINDQDFEYLEDGTLFTE